MTTAEFITCELLGCGQYDIETLFGTLTDGDYFSNAVHSLKENGLELSAGGIWTECIFEAFHDVFGNDVEPDIYFNSIDPLVSLSHEIAGSIEDFTEKASDFYKLTGFEVELFC